jgi:dTDP-4-dehydrorhamnose 3,5-epimerase
MQIRETSIAGLVEILPRVFADDRGMFFESYNEEIFAKLGLPVHFVQDNQSFSKKAL